MLDPRGGPILGFAQFQLRIHLIGGIDTEVVGKELWLALIDNVAPVENRHRIVKLQMSETVRDGEHQTLVLTRQGVQKLHNVVLGLRVESACDFIAKQDLRLARQLDCQCESAPLSPGEHAYAMSFEFLHSHFAKDAVDVLAGRPCVPKPHCECHALANRELLMRDAELRHISNLRRGKILILEIASLPENLPFLLAGRYAGDEFQEGRLPAT